MTGCPGWINGVRQDDRFAGWACRRSGPYERVGDGKVRGAGQLNSTSLAGSHAGRAQALGSARSDPTGGVHRWQASSGAGRCSGAQEKGAHQQRRGASKRPIATVCHDPLEAGLPGGVTSWPCGCLLERSNRSNVADPLASE